MSACLLNISHSFVELTIDWDDGLISLTGVRGVGKSSYLINHIKNKFPEEVKALCMRLDDIYFSNTNMVNFAGDWLNRRGTHLFLDEIHKYPNWLIELKNIYDRYKKLKVVSTGLSLIRIYSGEVDLGRRALISNLHNERFIISRVLATRKRRKL